MLYIDKLVMEIVSLMHVMIAEVRVMAMWALSGRNQGRMRVLKLACDWQMSLGSPTTMSLCPFAPPG